MPSLPHARTIAFAAVAVAVALAILLVALGPTLVASRVRAAAAGRGLAASWRSLRIRPPLAVAIAGLRMVDARGDTAMRVADFEVSIDPMSLLLFSPRPDRFRLAGAHIDLDHLRRPDSGADPFAELPPQARRGGHGADHLPALRRAARRIVRVLTLPAHRLPRIEMADVSIRSADDDGSGSGVHIDTLGLARYDHGTRLLARGTVTLETDVRFVAAIDYGRDEHLTGGIDFALPQPAEPETLHIGVGARLVQERAPHGLRVAEGSRILLGHIPLAVSGLLSESGPRLGFDLAADGVRPADVTASVPASLLGPLLDVGVRGSFDYRLRFVLDLAHPDSIDFDADVIPHGLALAPERTRLGLRGLDQPFVATIHLPKGRIEVRELSAANPHFVPLDGIDSVLAHAVVTNEDGGFFRHRGFNTEAVKDAIVENLRAGAYRRGAGTISMQLVRNLYLGHERALARKAQEVVLAWILEHLTGVDKRRLLEIYLNIIEWGPGIHGADEATHYYFGHGAQSVTVDEALFLTTLIPSPNRWRGRLDPNAGIRPATRAQMHFIGRAMIAKGWLDPARLPPADSLRVELAGPARELLSPPPAVADTTASALPDSLAEQADADSSSI